MKIINEKGKLFGIINPVDLMVVILALVVAGTIGVRLMGSKVTETIARKTDCYVQVRVIGAHPSLATEVRRQNLAGQRMVSGNEYLSATVEDVWTEPYRLQVTTDDGEILTSTDPDKLDIIILMKTQVAPDTPSPKIGSQELRSGKTFIVKTQTFEISGTIRYVEIGGYNPPAEFAGGK